MNLIDRFSQFQIEREVHSFRSYFHEQFSNNLYDVPLALRVLQEGISLWVQTHQEDPVQGPLSRQWAAVLKDELQSLGLKAQIDIVSRSFSERIACCDAYQQAPTDPRNRERYEECLDGETLESIDQQIEILEELVQANREKLSDPSIQSSMQDLLALRLRHDDIFKQMPVLEECEKEEVLPQTQAKTPSLELFLQWLVQFLIYLKNML